MAPQLRVAEHDDEPRAEPLGGELDAADLRRRDDVARDADHEQIAEALIEHDLGRHARVRAAEDRRKRPLAGDDGHAPNAARELVDRVLACDEAAIAVAQTLERVARRDHAVILVRRLAPLSRCAEYSRSPPFGTQCPARASAVATSMLKRTKR